MEELLATVRLAIDGDSGHSRDTAQVIITPIAPLARLEVIR